MVSRNTYFSTLVLVSTLSSCLVVSTRIPEWDFAVAIGKEIHFFSRNGTMTSDPYKYKIPDARKLENLAYDSKKNIMFVSDNANPKNVTIYSIALNDNNPVPTPVLSGTNDYEIMAMVFHPNDKRLYWTDSKKKAVMRMRVKPDHDEAPEEFHPLTGRAVWGITVDACTKFIYWSSCANTMCRVERDRPSKTQKAVLFEIPTMHAYGLAVDQWAEKLYWVDDVPGFEYQIWRSNLDGKDRELLNQGEHQHPFYIAVDNDTVYWTDMQGESIWKVGKNPTVGNPICVKSYSEQEHNVRIMSILTRKSTIKIKNCR